MYPLKDPAKSELIDFTKYDDWEGEWEDTNWGNWGDGDFKVVKHEYPKGTIYLEGSTSDGYGA